MNLPKEFEWYLKNGIAKRISPDTERARFLVEESANSFEGLKERVKIIGINKRNANSIVKDCYDILMELIRAKLLTNGLSCSGQRAHEAEVSFLEKIGIEEIRISFMNDLRHFRNSATYYGKILDAEYAQKVVAFTEKFYLELKSKV